MRSASTIGGLCNCGEIGDGHTPPTRQQLASGEIYPHAVIGELHLLGHPDILRVLPPSVTTPCAMLIGLYSGMIGVSVAIYASRMPGSWMNRFVIRRLRC